MISVQQQQVSVAQKADDLTPSTSAAASAAEQPVQHVSKKAKLFDFMFPSTAMRPVLNQLTMSMADLSWQFDLFKSDGDLQSSGLEVFNEKRFSGLMPLARNLHGTRQFSC